MADAGRCGSPLCAFGFGHAVGSLKLLGNGVVESDVAACDNDTVLHNCS